MKHPLAFLLASVFAHALASGADSAFDLPGVPRDDSHPINIRIEMQVVAIPDDLAVPLAGDLKKKEKVEAANAKIQEMLAKGIAKLIAWPIVTTKSGRPAFVESVNELRYATEYAPPVVSVSTTFDPPEAAGNSPKVDLTHLDGVPAVFETRNVGVTLEVQPVLSPNGKTIDLTLVPQHVRLKGFNKATIAKPSTGGRIVVEQPDFDVMKVTSSLTVRNGQRILLGIFRTSEYPKHMELFILKAEAIPVE